MCACVLNYVVFDSDIRHTLFYDITLVSFEGKVGRTKFKLDKEMLSVSEWPSDL